ncbi:HepT-like ribonuclease domain-containing protein [Methylobacterium oxalidis]|uniref:HepT-like ribonuclease domain-containing protein n=1 Tax=Methylobacterium oxalidis TaxID=944322 RepID=UPI0033149F9D
MLGIQHATSGKSYADFRADWLLRHGVQRGIEIISEASRSLPAEVQALRPEIPWPQIRATGNVLRHEYHSLSDPLIWRVVVDELPRLLTAVEAIEAGIVS